VEANHETEAIHSAGPVYSHKLYVYTGLALLYPNHNYGLTFVKFDVLISNRSTVDHGQDLL